MNYQSYSHLLKGIKKVLDKGREDVFYTVNDILIKTYWEIGRQIVEYEQEGRKRAEYGETLLKKLSTDLKSRYGHGFSISNLQYMRLLYQKYQTLSGESEKHGSHIPSGRLSWSHYVELLVIDDDMERSFYEKQCTQEKWSVRELRRQISSGLFYRLALNKDKKGVIRLAHKGQHIKSAEDIVKDPYILEFLGLPNMYSEKDLEQKLTTHLQMFLLELGKDFLFVGRQYRITLGNTHYYVDLVLYHRILKCFVLIDLKIGKATPADVGQMNMYLNYFKEEEKSENEPVGIILSAHKDSIEAKYALGSISNNLFISKYKLYLPDKKQLEKKLKELLN